MKCKKIKNALLIIIALIMCISFTGCTNTTTLNKKDGNIINIVTTNFPCYDFARAIVGQNENVRINMLLKPGMDSHSYDPTPSDVILIQNCDMFIHVGGHSDTWVEKILSSFDSSNISIVKMSDYVTMIPVKNDEHEEHEHDENCNHEHGDIEYDEHVWTSPKNSIRIMEGFLEEIIKLDLENKEMYEKNAKAYIEEIKKLDESFKEVVSNSRLKEVIFADRFPIIYFTNEYGLDYHAAFPSCSSKSEVSAQMLAFLINEIKESDIKYVFHLEMSNEKVASVLCEEVNVKSLLFHAAHNVSKEELENGETYVSLMSGNVERLKKALE